MINLKIKKIHPEAVVPKHALPGDAGLDLTTTNLQIVLAENKIIYSTGLAVEIPEGHVGLLFPRSSIHKKSLSLANSVGVIDSGYRGEVKVVFRLTNGTDVLNLYQIGDRVAQLVVMPYPQVNIEEVSELTNTVRGENGYGSTGN